MKTKDIETLRDRIHMALADALQEKHSTEAFLERATQILHQLVIDELTAIRHRVH